MGKLSKKNSSKLKVSEMLMDVARGYIAIGEDIEHKQQLLNGAASAWNIACLGKEKRKQAIKKYMRRYRKMNPHQTKQVYRNAEKDFNLLIKEKDKLYPGVRVQIAHVEGKEIGEKLHVTVMSMGEQ